METRIFLDLETIPCHDEGTIAKIRDSITPPANIKKDESKEKWLSENLEQATKDAVAKTSFDPARGHICTIGWAINDDDVMTAHAETVDQERGVLESFFGSFNQFHKVTFIGHNVGAFDLRFILCRAVVLGVRIPQCVPRDPKPWDKTVFDTMQAWAGTRGTISMDNLCGALGLVGKDGFDGSMVADAWDRGEHERIAEYCADDVRKTREVWRRFDAVGWNV